MKATKDCIPILWTNVVPCTVLRFPGPTKCDSILGCAFSLPKPTPGKNTLSVFILYSLKWMQIREAFQLPNRRPWIFFRSNIPEFFLGGGFPWTPITLTRIRLGKGTCLLKCHFRKYDKLPKEEYLQPWCATRKGWGEGSELKSPKISGSFFSHKKYFVESE